MSVHVGCEGDVSVLDPRGICLSGVLMALYLSSKRPAPLLGVSVVTVLCSDGTCVNMDGSVNMRVHVQFCVVCVDTGIWGVCVCVVHEHRLLVCMYSYWVLGYVDPGYVLR